MSTLSKRLNDLIKRSGMDITELAESIDEEPDKLEKAIQNSSVDVRVLEKIAKELGISLYTIFPRPASSVLNEYFVSPAKKELDADMNDDQSKIYYLEAVIEQLRNENTKMKRCLGEIKSSVQKHEL